MNAVFPQAVPDAAVRTENRPGADADTPALWSVALLGGLDLSDGTQHITRLPSRAVTALLARLALAPERAHGREELIELLWPGVALDVGRNRLRQALSTLKAVLEPGGRVPPQPVLLADRISVRVVPGSLGCDALRFERHARAGRIEAARALYRGELLPGFYDDWIDEERLRLAALHERLADATVAPAATPSAPAPPRAGATRIVLPTYLTRVFGADEQAARLRGLVLTHRLVTLIGPGGSGKTRLAVEMAHSLRTDAGWPVPTAENFAPFDLIAFVPLAACSTRAQACDALTRALQITPRADDPLLGLTDALAGRRALLLLDNFEQLVGHAQDLVAHLTGLLPTLHVVVTSRRALGLDGEHELSVAALELPAAGAGAGEAAGNPAIALFVERARAVRADFHFSARNGAVLVELVRALDGMPLAIELAASRVRSIAPAEMLARLRGAGTPRLDLLSRSGPRGALDSRHASMQRVIAWSWEQLGAEQARLLSALTVFPDGFTATSAAALVNNEALDAQLLLDELVAHSLVHAQAGNDETLRFGLYPPIREFAAAQGDVGTALHWRARLRVWALAWAQALPRTPPLDMLRTEVPNLMAAMASAVGDQTPDDAIQLLLALRRCVEDVEWPAEGLAHAQAAIDQCGDALLQSRGRALLAPMLFTAGQADAALREAELGLQCPLLDAAQRARALHSLARVRWRSLRRAEQVEPLLDEAQALAGPNGEPELRASLLALRAFVTNAHHQDHATGERLHAQALAVWERLGNQHAINSGRYNLAVCAQNAGRQRDALRQLEPIIASARELQDWRRLSQSLNVRGNAHSALRAWPLALADYQECIATAWKSVASFDLAHGLWNLPRTLAHLRQPEAAVRIAGFASWLWRSRFGELTASDARDLRCVRRLASCQIGAARVEALWREGEQLSLSQAVALGLGRLPAT
jgi:predicted ATPase/tetratricopeptide (TPR) repeat protein